MGGSCERPCCHPSSGPGCLCVPAGQAAWVHAEKPERAEAIILQCHFQSCHMVLGLGGRPEGRAPRLGFFLWPSALPHSTGSCAVAAADLALDSFHLISYRWPLALLGTRGRWQPLLLLHCPPSMAARAIGHCPTPLGSSGLLQERHRCVHPAHCGGH